MEILADMETPERNDHSDAEHEGHKALAAAFEAIAEQSPPLRNYADGRSQGCRGLL